MYGAICDTIAQQKRTFKIFFLFIHYYLQCPRNGLPKF